MQCQNALSLPGLVTSEISNQPLWIDLEQKRIFLTFASVFHGRAATAQTAEWSKHGLI